MSDWEYFAFMEPRPEGVEVVTEANRRTIERAVAEQVALLLSTYGDIEDPEIDMSGNPNVDKPVTFTSIELSEEVLDDDSEFRVKLLPELGNGWDIRPGAYSIEHFDEDGGIVRLLRVYDAMLDITPQVQDCGTGQALGLPLLQELYEGLVLLVRSYAENSEANDPPHDLTEYPYAPLFAVEFTPPASRLVNTANFN